MKLNIVLICLGLSLLAVAVSRMGVVKIDRKFIIDFLPLAVAITASSWIYMAVRR